jgi:cytochrome c-type biogenesis protein CcmF
MLDEAGFIAMLLALVAALVSIVASVYGEWSRHERFVLVGRNAALVTFPLLGVSTGALLFLLMTQNYQNAYVWSVSSPSMSSFFRATALWGSQAGSLLFWSFLMSLFSFLAILLNWRSDRRLMPYAIAVMMAVLAFFLALSVFFENPFERWWILQNGDVGRSALIPAGALVPDAASLSGSANGLNPLLMHFGMAIHPPMLYLGFVGFVVPFGFAVAALASGDLSTNWIKATRRWSLVAWLFLGLGLILGGRWAYDVLGWGGYWGWDPVENAAFLPWLIGTAFIHSAMIQQKRGMLKVWNMLLVLGTFSAVIFGTFATRSGLVDSVHSFARSEVGIPMFLFWATLSVLALALLLWRWERGDLKDDRGFTSLLSREALFVLNNFVFLALFFAIFWGSFGAPIITELFAGVDITLGTDYFMMVTPPLFLLLYILMGVAPLSAWGATSLRRLGRSLLVPALLTLATLVVFILMGMTTPVSLVGYSVVLLAGWVAIHETVRGVLARMRSQGENPLSAFWALLSRNPRRYGGYIVHLGITVIGIGVIGSTLFQMETQQTLAVGESLQIGDYQLRYDAFQGGQLADDGRFMDIANVTVIRNGNEIAQLRPRRDFFPTGGDMSTMTIAGAHSTLENDFYVLLVDWNQINASSATFKVYVNPLVNLVWWGGLILILGTLVSVWPREEVPERVRESRARPADAVAKPLASAPL